MELKEIIKKCTYILPDKVYLNLRYYMTFHRFPNWKNPQTYNEKLQWLKLYDRRPEYTTMVDKLAVKDFVASRIGSEHLIPTIGSWDSVDQIDLDLLPERFVLKCTHDSGGVIICKDKKQLDWEQAKQVLRRGLKTNYYQNLREWPYKNVKPRILAEQYMEDPAGGELRDYKFFCFDGVPRVMFVSSDRQDPNEHIKLDYFDMDYNHLPFKTVYPNAKKIPPKPDSFQKMQELAALLSAGIPQSRIDLYEIGGQIYFGEITLFHGSGLFTFDPPSWDKPLATGSHCPKKSIPLAELPGKPLSPSNTDHFSLSNRFQLIGGTE